MGELRYCFEQDYVAKTLKNTKKQGLAVIDSDGISKAVIQQAVSRGVMVYDYINAGALEKGRSYYDKYKHLRLARYEGWPDEYWIDPTDEKWKQHCLDLARQAREKGAIGIYLDNTDIYYQARHIKKSLERDLPDQTEVYRALRSIVCGIADLGLIVMPNGGDAFVRRFYTEHPTVIKTINQEGALFEDFKRQPKSERQFRTEYMDWARKKGMYVRGIEYCKKTRHMAECKAYYKLHGWKGLYRILLKSKTEIKNTKTGFKSHVTTICAPTTPYNKIKPRYGLSISRLYFYLITLYLSAIRV